MRLHIRRCFVMVLLVAAIFLLPVLTKVSADTMEAASNGGIQSIVFEDMRVKSCTGGEYRSDTGQYDSIITWYFYNIENWNYTVTLSNGDVIKHTEKDEKLGFYVGNQYYEPAFSAFQSAYASWQCGLTYNVKARVAGLETNFSFSIEQPVINAILFDEVHYEEGQNGNYETAPNGEKWYRYNLENWNYTVEFTNGDRLVHTDEDKARGFYYDGVYYDVYTEDRQSHKNQWQPGNHPNHTATVYAGGSANIRNYRIWGKDEMITDIHFVEKTISAYSAGYEDANGDWNWHYSSVNQNYTVTFGNGDTITHTENDPDGFDYKGRHYTVEFAELDATVPGEYEIAVSCVTYKGSYTLKILANENLLSDKYQSHYICGDYAYVIRKREANIIAYLGDDKEVNIPAELDGFPVTKICEDAFFHTESIERLILSDGIKELERMSIHGCPNLRYIYLPKELETIAIVAAGPIWKNPKLETVEVSPDHPLLQVVNGTLYDKAMASLLLHPTESKLETLVIPEGVECIWTDACSFNPYLKKMVMPDSVVSIGYWAFEGCTNLESVNISKNCKIIGQYAFEDTALREIYLPAGLESLLEGFETLPYLENIYVDEANPHYFSVDGVLYGEGAVDDKEYHLICYPAAKESDTYTVLPGTTAICASAFEKAKNLKTIVLPKTLTSIGDRAFEGCNRLETLICFGSLKSVGECLFTFDEALKNIFCLKNSVKIIEVHTNQTPQILSAAKAENLQAQYYPTDCNTVGGQHAYRERPLVRATQEKDGKLVKVCSKCGKEVSSKTIYRIASIKLSTTKRTYTGKNVAPPKLVIKDRKGNILVEGRDYVAEDLVPKLPVRRYKALIQFQGKYEVSRTNEVYWAVVPAAPKTVKAELCGYDDVKVSWSKSEGADFYKVYYKKAGAKKYTYLTKTTKCYTKKAKNLKPGTKYVFKVVPYLQSGEKSFSAITSETASVRTLKRVTGLKVSTRKGNVNVSWKNISGETGCQISQSVKKNGTRIVATITSDTADNKLLKAAKGKKYYYKVRAYKIVKLNGKTKKIYGPWSKPKTYTRRK